MFSYGLFEGGGNTTPKTKISPEKGAIPNGQDRLNQPVPTSIFHGDMLVFGGSTRPYINESNS